MAIQTGGALAGLAVVTLSGGERIGRVDDVLFRPESGQIAGFLVDRGGMFSKPSFLTVEQVQAIGPDALTLRGDKAQADAAPGATEASGLPAKSLGGRPILNEAGTILGKVADVAVDTDAMTVPYLLLATGLLDNALHGKPQLPFSVIQTIGADSIIVSSTYDPKAPDAHA